MIVIEHASCQMLECALFIDNIKRGDNMKLQQRLALLMTAAVVATAMPVSAQNNENTAYQKQTQANWSAVIDDAVPVYKEAILADIVLEESVAGLLTEEDAEKRTFTLSLVYF